MQAFKNTHECQLTWRVTFSCMEERIYALITYEHPTTIIQCNLFSHKHFINLPYSLYYKQPESSQDFRGHM